MLYYLNADLSALDSRWENWLNNQKFKTPQTQSDHWYQIPEQKSEKNL